MQVTFSEHYTVIVYTGGFYILFPDKWLFKNNKTIFYPEKTKKNRKKEDIFYYKHYQNYVHISGSLFRLWQEKGKLKKELRRIYYRRKAIFKVYFWRGSFNAWMRGMYPEYAKRHQQLQMLDKKMMTFGSFLKYFSAKTIKEGSLAWEYHTKKHFRRTLTIKQPKKKPDKYHISKKLLETINLIQNGKNIQVTKMKSLNRLNYLDMIFDYEVFYDFARFIANKILSRFESGESLCAEANVSKEQKLRILTISTQYINACFNDTVCDIDLPNKIATIFDEIVEIGDTKRLYSHVRRNTLRDADLLAIKECLGFFIHDNDTYPSFWKREYDIAKYYCVSCSDMRFRLQEHSIPRVRDILNFVDAYVGNKSNLIEI